MWEIIAFALGVSAGIAFYRIYIMHLIKNPGHTICDYCQFAREREVLFPEKKK